MINIKIFSSENDSPMQKMTGGLKKTNFRHHHDPKMRLPTVIADSCKSQSATIHLFKPKEAGRGSECGRGRGCKVPDVNRKTGIKLKCTNAT